MAKIVRVLLEQSEPNWNLEVQTVHVVGKDVDQERGVGVPEELKQRLDESLRDRRAKLGGGGGKRCHDKVDEGEGGGDRDPTDAEVTERQVDVVNGKEEDGCGGEGDP